MSTFTAVEKTCSRCGVPKELNDLNFLPHRDPNVHGKPHGDGYGSWCRQCHREYCVEWRKAHPGNLRQWKAANPDKVLTASRRYEAKRLQQRLACQLPAN